MAKKNVLTCYPKSEIKDRLRAYAEREGRSVSNAIEHLLTLALERDEQQTQKRSLV